MPKFAKRPVVVHAVQLDPCGAHKTALPEGVIGVPPYGPADLDAERALKGLPYGLRLPAVTGATRA